MSYQITCCSTADLSLDFFKERDIAFACFRFEMDGKDYKDDYGKSISLKAFYDAIRAGKQPTTSQVSTGEYIDLWKPYLSSGIDVLHLSLSTGISGTYNSACIAAAQLNDEYQAKVTVIDSLCCSTGYGLLVKYAADNRDKGMNKEDNISAIRERIQYINHWFFSTDLSSYIRGGRISKFSGFAGNLLHICPLMTVDSKGRLVVKKKIRTKKKTMEETLETMKNRALNGTLYDGDVFICHSDCIEDAENLSKMIEDSFPNIKKPSIFEVGTTIGSHTGPGTVALFYYGKKRDED